jgi:hypothetical protein
VRGRKNVVSPNRFVSSTADSVHFVQLTRPLPILNKAFL